MSATWKRFRDGARIPLEGEARLSSAIRLGLVVLRRSLTPNPSPCGRGEIADRKSRGVGEDSAARRSAWTSSAAISVFLCATICLRILVMQQLLAQRID